MGNCQAVNDITLPIGFQGIIFKCRTWNKTYSNLFDYSAQSSQLLQKNITVNPQLNQTISLIRKHEQLQISSQKILPETELLRVTNNNCNYWLQSGENPSKLTTNQVWLVVKSLPRQKYKLKQSDMLRIGSQKVKVKQIIYEDNQIEQNMQIKSKFKVYQHIVSKEKSGGYDPDPKEQQPICRVCLQEGEVNNPLLAPCRCSGSAKFIHIKCIQLWFNKLINPRNINASIVITWKPLICELCNQSLPFKIYLDEIKHFTVNIPRPEKPYIVLNPIPREKTTSKLYLLVSFKNKKILTIGRKKEADIVLDQDNTVSRFHSSLHFEQDKNKKWSFYLGDKDSKFGTLVLLRKGVNLNSFEKGLAFQFGGSVANISVVADKYGEQEQLNKQQIKSESDSNEEKEEENKESKG